MKIVPVTLRPAFVVRRKAMRQGVLGSSTLWKVVAVVVFGRSTLQKVFGKQPETLGRRVIRPGQVMVVAASKPLTRRQRKRTGITKAVLTARARADLDAAQRAS